MFFISEAFAIEAYPELINFVQPDGSKIEIYLKGDEKVRWAETKDGYTILFNETGFYEYAIINESGNLILSGIIAENKQNRTSNETSFLLQVNKHLTYDKSQVSLLKQMWNVYEQEAKNQKAFPTTGDRNLICVLIGFTDLSFTKTQADFNSLFNQIGYNAGSATGSVKDYYLENSWDQFNLTVDVAGPYTASHDMEYYGGNVGGNDQRPRELVTEAINLANPDVNFANYDNDNNGYVDAVYVIYAGYGEEAGASDDAIWAHAWSIPSVTLDGVTISRYSCSSELRGNSGTNLTRIGVICHEFGHVLGAPDFYDTDYDTGGKYDGTGRWDLMAGGSWNNGGATPAHHNGFTKWYYYNWLTPVELTTSQDVTLNNIEDYPQAYYYTTPTSNEYWFIENRQQTGFDAALPGHGMIIYHVDQDNVDAYDYSNDINATHPQYMHPVCASASTNPNSTPSSYGTINGSGCPFPGTSNATEFSDATTPSSTAWNGNPTNKPLINIAENGGVITFCFISCASPDDPQNFTAIAAGENQIDLSWDLNTDNDPIVVAYSTNPTFGTPTDGVNYSSGMSISGGGEVIYNGTNTSYNHVSLDANTTYYYKAWSLINASPDYSQGVISYATTSCGLITNFPFTEGFESGTLPNCWSYDGTEWTYQNGGQSGNPASAHTGSKNALFYHGSSTADVSKLITPQMDMSSFSDATLTFWHTQVEWPNDQDELRIYYKTSSAGSWNLIATYTYDITNWTQETIDLPSLSDDYYVAFEATGQYGRGVAIDDINISGSISTPTATVSATPDCITGSVTVNSNLSGNQTFYLRNNSGGAIDNWTGNATSHEFTGLADGTYRGQVLNGLATSTLSDAVTLTNLTSPTQPSAISGESAPCEASSQTYSVTNVAGVTYAWSLPTGWSGSSTSNEISVTVGATDGDITVTPTSGCGTGTARSLSVAVDYLPAQPSTISGETNLCEGTQETYSVTNIPGTTYVWNLPSGWSGSSTTNSIDVTIGTISGSINVSPENTCGFGTDRSLAITVNNVPAQTSSIVGEANPCVGSTQTYSVPNVTDVTYTWVLPANWTGTSTTNEITVTVGETSGDIVVTPSNDCGNGTTRSLTVSANTNATSITQNPEDASVNIGSEINLTVVAEGSNLTYQWRLEGSDITNANLATYQILSATISDAGNYDVVVTGDCGVETSEVAVVDFTTSIEELKNNGINIYPNPSTGLFTVSFSKEVEDVKVAILDITGRTVYNQLFENTNINTIDLTNEAKGLYLIRFNIEGRVITSILILK